MSDSFSGPGKYLSSLELVVNYRNATSCGGEQVYK